MTYEYTAEQILSLTLNEVSVILDGYMQSGDMDNYNHVQTIVRSLYKCRADRQAEYPSIGDQLDDLFHAGAFSAEMTAKIQAVKDKYPKPE